MNAVSPVLGWGARGVLPRLKRDALKLFGIIAGTQREKIRYYPGELARVLTVIRG
jgi:hypothetical protein